MKKIIKRIGNSIGIILDREDAKIYEIKLGDVVEVHIRKIKKGELK